MNKIEVYKPLLTDYLKAMKIAKELLVSCPPKGFKEQNVNTALKILNQLEGYVVNDKSASLPFLRESISELLTYYQEGSGPHVEQFWKKLKEDNIPFKRENKMLKILKRKKIKDAVEYDFVVDIIVPYLQEGLITEDESAALNKMISEYEEHIAKGIKPQR